MEIRRITFKAPFPEPHLSLDCWPPFPEVNSVYAAAAKAFIDPYRLALEVGKIEEKTALHFFARLYSEGVIDKSPTPGFEKLTQVDWATWLMDHPDHFAELRALCEHEGNWPKMKEALDGGTAGPLNP